MKKHKICLLLTGTIAPVGVPGVARANPEERENDYFTAISEWLKLGIPLIFVENSNFTSERIQNLMKHADVNTEYLAYFSKKSKLGKGPGEADILSYAFANSKILKNSALAAKVSGRYYVKNSSSILGAIRQEEDIDIYADMPFNLSYVDTQFFIFSPSFYETYLKPRLSQIDETSNVFIEHIVGRSILALLANGKRSWRLLPERPTLIGYSGSNGKKIENNPIKLLYQKLKHKIKKYLLETNL